MSSAPSRSEPGFLKQVKQNPHGLAGFILSLLQLVVHGVWMAFATLLASTGQAQQLDSGSWQLWVIAVLILLGGILTMVSLFLCLYGAIRGTPKALAIAGLCLSFFVGTFTTFALLMNAMGS
ncbi:MAG: hypothetical protein R3C59_20185 [Planctomycetaceae bacterium]